MRGLRARIPLLAVLMLHGMGCDPGPGPAIDLVHWFPLAEVQSEVVLIDFGTPSARPHLARGWHQDEGPGRDGTTFVWSRGGVSAIEFFLAERRPVSGRLRCRPYQPGGSPPQAVTPYLNGAALDEIVLEPGFREYDLPLPLSRQVIGVNRLDFRYRFNASPKMIGSSGDWRRLAVAFDWLRLGGITASDLPHPSPSSDALTLRPGSEITYHFRFAPRLELRIAAVEAGAASAGLIQVVVATDREGEVTRAELRVGDAGRSIPISGPAGEPFRLVLRAGNAPESESGEIRLVRPELFRDRAAHMENAASEIPSTSDRPNVVIYLVDALRADRLSGYGHSRPTSPELDTFARRATLYERAYAQSSWTRPAVASLFTGLRPEVHGANRRQHRLGPGPPTLAERLSRAGYQTAAVVSNPNVAAEFGFDRGFDHFELSPVDGRRSSDLNRRVSEWLDRLRRDEPFMLYVHTVDPHLPYDPPPGFRERFASNVEREDLGSTRSVGALLDRDLDGEGDLAADLLDLYDAEVAANDHSFGVFLDELERRDLLSGSMIVFLSDHGEEFFDHGGWIHGRTLYREMLHVPLVISYPGQRQGRREGAPVQHVDLFPTVLGVVGLEVDAPIHGRSLLAPPPENRGIAAFLDHDGWWGRSVIRGGWHPVRHGREGFVGRPELYEVETDPHELRDRGAELGVLAGTLLSEAHEEVVDEEGVFGSSEVEIDEELRERLRALGYI